MKVYYGWKAPNHQLKCVNSRANICNNTLQLKRSITQSRATDEEVQRFDGNIPPDKKQLRAILSPHEKYTVAKGENELVRKLDSGWSLIQTLSDDKYLLKF